ncbi:uncharacterized protein B0J16DRAFT_272106 [Fusarium flagelliforme]|uniref:uncharacterized protein n=1 Tax=Fusarium flagelliforme TaxID=2675880 RepID=UPI001E8E1DA2|nr:uncharacterized protein B0J16DRAFT_272106 [Fusarium flagelliforme]KAH7179792.1 hypothetical protein B0J16DRAFT_272106 [Fusarium flagelliforme]
MASHRHFPKSAPSSPTYKLKRTHNQALGPREADERQQLSARPRSLAEPFYLVGVSHLADTSNGAERSREAEACPRTHVPRSRGLHQLSNLDMYSHASQPSLLRVDSDYELYSTSPRRHPRVSLENTLGSLPMNGQPSHLPSDEGLAHTGSWCHSAPTESRERQLDIYGSERDVLSEDWRPRTPTDTRLSTPDLPPLSTDFEFCPCHLPGEHEQDRINEDFYFATRSKMDMQKQVNEWSRRPLDASLSEERGAMVRFVHNRVKRIGVHSRRL